MEWKPYLQLPWSRPLLVDGTRAKRGAYLMRRRAPDGSWQYRLMTPTELLEQSDLHAF